ncbi:BEN domain-containing protein 5-like [Ixodes scapularis]|uniref:BEN domain-containing protein 5-like n=1 Tax=Ixodes scapularis TaxID=6945 RepID=UPI001AD6244E|nr:BEN domain-containing protein 5-like [Ixodes scapularis]
MHEAAFHERRISPPNTPVSLPILIFYRCISTTVDVKMTWKAWGDNIVNQDIRSSIAVKNLAIALWGSSVLQRTVVEMASNVSLNKDSRLPLTPKKAAFLRECLMMKLRGQKHHADVIAVMSRTAKVNHILGEKMNDRRKQEK